GVRRCRLSAALATSPSIAQGAGRWAGCFRLRCRWTTSPPASSAPPAARRCARWCCSTSAMRAARARAGRRQRTRKPPRTAPRSRPRSAPGCAGHPAATLSAVDAPAPTARLLDDRATRLFIALAAFFCVNAVLAEFIGVKIFALEDTLGIAPLAWNLFGQNGSLSFTAGTLLWPVAFVFTDVVSEYFGRRGVKMISWIAVALIVYGFVFAFVAIALAPADWWVDAARAQGVPDYQPAFAAVFGLGLWKIAGSGYLHL